MKICYRKKDLIIVGTVPPNIDPLQEIKLNVIPNFGGSENDYNFIETTEPYFHLELIDGVVTVVRDEPLEEPQPPTLEEQLAEKDKQIQLLKEQQLRTDADLSAFMDFILMGGI